MIAKEFNPSIDKSYYITRHLLLDNLKDWTKWLFSDLCILDFGAGSSPYAHLFKTPTYVRVDFEGKGHSHDKEEKAIYYDGKHIPFKDENFDLILSTEVFEHIFNLDEVLDELYRVSKKDGLMIITCPMIIAEHEMPNHFANYTSSGIKHLLKKHGFEIIAYKKIGTSIQAQMQMFMSYLDSYVICKFKKIGLYKPVAAVVFSLLNIWTMFLNWLLPKRYDSFLNHIIICKK